VWEKTIKKMCLKRPKSMVGSAETSQQVRNTLQQARGDPVLPTLQRQTEKTDFTCEIVELARNEVDIVSKLLHPMGQEAGQMRCPCEKMKMKMSDSTLPENVEIRAGIRQKP
jgi:hypothetical protein